VVGKRVLNKELILQVLREKYESEGGEQIAKDFEVPWGTVRSWASLLGLQSKEGSKRQARARSRNSTSVNTGYFQGPWTPEMAYVVGYIYADGCNNEKGKSQAKGYRSLDFKCTEKDKEVIESIKKILDSKHKISNLPERTNITSITKRAVSLQVSNTYLAKSLEERFGVVPRKSQIDVSFPLLPCTYEEHFVRGYMDGDGCCREKLLGLYGSKNFITGIRDLVCSHVQVRKPPVLKASSIWKVQWQARGDIKNLYHWLYPIGEYPFLLRKREALLCYLEKQP